MRRMYTKKQLNQAVADFLANNPSDVIEALDGQDVEVGSLNASGLVTGAEIVEKMDGYTCAIGRDDGFTYEKVYFGAVKNGNKLTIVCAVNITKTTGTAAATLANFTIPISIADKLYPAIGIYLDIQNIICNVDRNNYVEAICSTAKTIDGKLRVDLSTSNLVANQKYYVRYEATFLLSDSL